MTSKELSALKRKAANARWKKNPNWKHSEATKRKLSRIQRIAQPKRRKKEGYRRDTRYGKLYRDLRMATLKRDNYTCRICSKKAVVRKRKRVRLERRLRINLSIHHLRSWESNPKLRFRLSNAIATCRSCHQRLEMRRRKK